MDSPLDEQVKALLTARKGDWPQIARDAEVSHSWLSQFVRGKIENPGYRTLVRLHRALTANIAAPVAVSGLPEPVAAQQQAA